jgi:AbrB family looped-hinge helix DNA binding protein
MLFVSLAKSKLTAQGQISVPAAVRRKLGVGPGSVLEWEEVGARILVRRAATKSSQDVHDALFDVTPRRHSLDELKRGRARYVRKRHARH